MGNNLIHNYVNNPRNFAQTPNQNRANERNYFSVSSTMNSFDTETDKLIKPLDGKGYLVNENPIYYPKEFLRDTVYTTKALADGVRGKANDHQLGKLNDLGLKLGGVAIATYLMTRKSTPKTKAMEFIGFGAFLASMALWPKVALEIPAKLVHGFNFRKQYVDDQGRKKFVSQDPNYIPFDLYKGNKKSEDLDVIADRAGIKRDIQNRHESAKDYIRKVSVQNNTLWMLTAGIATPLMTALACNGADKFLTPLFEKHSNQNANKNIDKIDAYLSGTMNAQERAEYELKNLKLNSENETSAVDAILKEFKGKPLQEHDLTNLSETLAHDFDSEMKDAAKDDIKRLVGDSRYISNSANADSLTNALHSEIAKTDSALAQKLSAERIKSAVNDGIIRGAVRDMLTEVGFEVVDSNNNFRNSQVSTNFKCKEVQNIDFFKVTPETEGMSEVDRLAHNIKSIVMKVNNSNPAEDFIPGMSNLENTDRGLKAAIDASLQSKSEAIARNFYNGNLAITEGREDYIRQSVSKLFKSEAPRTPAAKSLHSRISGILTSDSKNHRGYVISDKASEAISKAAKQIKKYTAIDEILTSAAHFKVEMANETLVANNWAEVSNTLFDILDLDSETLKHASKDRNASRQIFEQKLETICQDDTSYKNFMEKLAQKMVKLDEKIDAPNSNSSGRMMNKVESGITKNCQETGETLQNLGMSEMRIKMLGLKKSNIGIDFGGLLNSKLERLHSRVDGVHSSYMRLLQTAEFFHRAHEYESAIASGRNAAELKQQFGFTENHEMNKEIIKRGKKLLLNGHTDAFYNKMGLHNNKDFFKSLMWAIYRPSTKAAWNEGWNESTTKTMEILDEAIKDKNGTIVKPRRVFDASETKGLGQKMMEHMNQMYNSMGSITRKILGDSDRIKVDGGVSLADQRACARFDLLGKAPAEFFHDSAKQIYNSKKWLKTFAPILGVTFATTVAAQFLFGKIDKDIKA